MAQVRMGYSLLDYLSHTFYSTRENVYFRSSITFCVLGIMLNDRERKMSGINVGLTEAQQRHRMVHHGTQTSSDLSDPGLQTTDCLPITELAWDLTTVNHL